VVGARNLNAPAAYVAAGAWPYARLSGPRIAVYAQLFARRVAAAIDGRTLREVARAAGISHSTLLAVILGQRWPDMVTIARLEDSLETELWPGVEARLELGPFPPRDDANVQPRTRR
jgi:transcriptional regulator with XRE-family HTH domain